MKKNIMYIYNQSNTGWDVEQTKDDRTSKIIKGKSCAIGIQNLNPYMRDFIADNNSEGDNFNVLTTDKNKMLMVKYAIKTLQPYLISREESSVVRTNEKVIALVSLDTTNCWITGMECNYGQVLANELENTDFNKKYQNFILAIGTKTDDCYVKLTVYNAKLFKSFVYTFTTSGVDKKEVEIESTKPIRLNSYKPNTITNLIIANEEDKELVEDFFTKNDRFKIENHDIKYVNFLTQNKVKNELIAAKWRAVTIFLNDTSDNIRQIERLLSIYKGPFDVVYIQCKDRLKRFY